jgi:hypothetical protein
MHLVFRLCFVLMLLGPLVSQVAGQGSASRPWIATVWIIKDRLENGSGVYLWSGLIITAAHLTNTEAKMEVRIAGKDLPATILKQGLYEEIDLSLLAIDEQKLPEKPPLPTVKLCEAPPWPGDRVLVVDARMASQSQIISPQVLPFSERLKFSTLIGDVATTGNSGSGVFDPDRRCLHGVMSRKFMQGDKDVAKYFVPAREIRDFIPAEFKQK